MKRLRATREELARFRRLVREAGYRSSVYRMLKEELTARGYWRLRPRGKPGLKNFRKDEQ